MKLEVDNVEQWYGNQRILGGVYLKAEIGKVTGILGRNGCGKSSLLKVIFGSLKSKYKLIRLDGKPILKPFYQTKLVKYLPQKNFVPSTIKLYTAFKLFEVSWGDFVMEFETFSIYKNAKIHSLSGGERRLVETYLVLKTPAAFVLLDEPFSNIAPLYVEGVLKIIEEEKQHKGIVLTDHMYQHIINSSDDIYLLKNGCTKLINELRELEDYHYLKSGSLN